MAYEVRVALEHEAAIAASVLDRHRAPIQLDCLDVGSANQQVGEQGMRRIADIGAAVIGTGFIGTVHVEQLRRIGVHVSRRARQHAGARRRPGPTPSASPRAYASLDALLDDPAVDVVHVTSPNHLHVPQARAILAAGRHVVCEKPLAMTAAESAELVDLAATTRPRQRRQLQHPLLPAPPARPRGGRPTGRSATSGS